MQSLVFNGVLDFPLLLIFLVILSLYAFRKSYYFFFQVITIYMVQLIQMVITLKVFYLTLTKISYIQAWFLKNKDDSFVVTCRVLFGIDFNALESGQKYHAFSHSVFYILLLSCKLAAGTYKLCKWADIRSYPTQENLRGDWFLARLSAYLILKTSIK